MDFSDCKLKVLCLHTSQVLILAFFFSCYLVLSFGPLGNSMTSCFQMSEPEVFYFSWRFLFCFFWGGGRDGLRTLLIKSDLFS